MDRSPANARTSTGAAGGIRCEAAGRPGQPMNLKNLDKERNMDKPLSVLAVSLAALVLAAAAPADAAILVQCPGDTTGDGVSDTPGVVCRHLVASDGYVVMADGRELYIFGFSDVTGVPAGQVMTAGTLAANFPGPAVVVAEGDQLYLTVSNASYGHRPDIGDWRTFHWSGYPQAAPIFNGDAESTIAFMGGASMTYFFQVREPGTFTYRGLAKPARSVQMGELGTIIVHAAQDGLPDGFPLGFTTHHTGNHYAYDDGDGSTRYDLEVSVQIGSFDAEFHDAVMGVQPEPYLSMQDDYAMLNGRGYPDTISPDAPVPSNNNGVVSQPQDTRIVAAVGQRVLLRLSNLSSTRAFTLATLGIPMRVVGRDGSLLRGPTGVDLSYTTGAITLGSGETADAILDISGVAPGTYFLYATNLSNLTNVTEGEQLGGMMTEIVIQ